MNLIVIYLCTVSYLPYYFVPIYLLRIYGVSIARYIADIYEYELTDEFLPRW